MEFGIHLPHIGPFHEGESMRRFAREVEDMGYDSVWASDHIVFPAGYQSRYPYSETGAFPLPGQVPWLEAVTSLTFIAGATSRIRLGTSICVLPYRNPVLNAKTFGNLDVLSGGRLIVGVGAGWMREEAEAMGMPFDNYGARTNEHIEVLKAVWTQEEPQYQGKYYTVPPVKCEPQPIQKPHPPIWVGGHETGALRRAAKYGDGWHAYRLTPEVMKEKTGQIHGWMKEYGRDPSSLILSVRAPLMFLDTAPAQPTAFLGTDDDIRHHLETYRDIGVQHVVMEPPLLAGIDAALEAVGRFATRIRPDFA